MITETEKIERSVGFIHALARQFLRLDADAAKELFVGIRPSNLTGTETAAWVVSVSYSGFNLETRAQTLSEALDDTLKKLMEKVMEHANRSADLIGEVRREHLPPR